MNKKRIFLFLLSITFILPTITTSFAHPLAQTGKLKSYFFDNTPYYGYFIGAEALGWRADENKHSEGSTITYKYSTAMTSEYIALVDEAIALWAGVIDFRYDENSTRYISLVDQCKAGTLAEFTNYVSDGNGHLIGWEIKISRSAPKSAKVIAHELGHAIGLIDLYDASNNDKLMYHAPSHSSATGPTSRDIIGAKVITGQHAHTWTYSYYATTSNGNMHIASACPSCGGEPVSAEMCTYNSNNRCIKCGTPKGASPYVSEEPEETE